MAGSQVATSAPHTQKKKAQKAMKTDQKYVILLGK